jgi:hypothetical protein
MEAFVPPFCHNLPNPQPPCNKQVIGCWREEMPTTTPQHLKPDKAAKDTPQEEVVQDFHTMQTQGALSAVLQAMPEIPIPGPAATMNCQTAKEPHILSRFGLP